MTMYVPTPEELDRYAKRDVQAAIGTIAFSSVTELPPSASGHVCCPTCKRALITDDIHVDPSVQMELTYDELEKVRAMTVAQLVSFQQLVARTAPQGTFRSLLAKTSVGNEYVAVGDWLGMFIGIERDGHTHS